MGPEDKHPDHGVFPMARKCGGGNRFETLLALPKAMGLSMGAGVFIGPKRLIGTA